MQDIVQQAKTEKTEELRTSLLDVLRSKGPTPLTCRLVVVSTHSSSTLVSQLVSNFDAKGFVAVYPLVCLSFIEAPIQQLYSFLKSFSDETVFTNSRILFFADNLDACFTNWTVKVLEQSIEKDLDLDCLEENVIFKTISEVVLQIVSLSSILSNDPAFDVEAIRNLIPIPELVQAFCQSKNLLGVTEWSSLLQGHVDWIGEEDEMVWPASRILVI